MGDPWKTWWPLLWPCSSPSPEPTWQISLRATSPLLRLDQALTLTLSNCCHFCFLCLASHTHLPLNPWPEPDLKAPVGHRVSSDVTSRDKSLHPPCSKALLRYLQWSAAQPLAGKHCLGKLPGLLKLSDFVRSVVGLHRLTASLSPVLCSAAHDLARMIWQGTPALGAQETPQGCDGRKGRMTGLGGLVN